MSLTQKTADMTVGFLCKLLLERSRVVVFLFNLFMFLKKRNQIDDLDLVRYYLLFISSIIFIDNIQPFYFCTMIWTIWNINRLIVTNEHTQKSHELMILIFLFNSIYKINTFSTSKLFVIGYWTIGLWLILFRFHK